MPKEVQEKAEAILKQRRPRSHIQGLEDYEIEPFNLG